MVNFQCCQCEFSTLSFLKLLQHYRYLHRGPNSRITCNILGCFRSFASSRTFQIHVRNKHSNFWAEHGRQRNIIDNVGILEIDNDVDEGLIENDANGQAQIMVPPQAVDVNSDREVASFMIGFREKFKVCHQACNFLASEFSDLIHLSSCKLRANLETALESADIDPLILNLDEIFQKSELEVAFDHYGDARHVNSFCAQNLNFVEPVEYVLGVGANGRQKTMQYINILETIKA